MSNVWERLKSTKTLKLVIGGLLTSVGMLVSGDMSGPEFVQALIMLGAALTVRDGVAKAEKK